MKKRAFHIVNECGDLEIKIVGRKEAKREKNENADVYTRYIIYYGHDVLLYKR